MKGVIDIGTNSVLLLLAERRPDGSLRVLRDESRVTRLGQGAAASGELHPDAIERTLAVLAEYRQLAEAAGATLEPVATEGLRMASNRDAFLEGARDVLGVDVQLISGDREAELSYLSVAREEEPSPLRVLDIGGGSTELVVGDGETIVSRCSHRIGSVRLTERWIDADPPTPGALRAMEDAALEAFAKQPLEPAPVLHGLAGTVTTAAALMLGLTSYARDRVDGTRWATDDVRHLRDMLARETVAERMKRPCLPAGRADVIVAGATILWVALRHCGATTLVVRDRGLRYALV